MACEMQVEGGGASSRRGRQPRTFRGPPTLPGRTGEMRTTGQDKGRLAPTLHSHPGAASLCSSLLLLCAREADGSCRLEALQPCEEAEEAQAE